MTPQPRYNEETAKEILKRAIDLQGDRSEADFSREQLLDMARDLGISEASLVRAEQSWLVEQAMRVEEATIAEYKAFERARRQRFLMHLTGFVVVTIFLFFINLATSPSHYWFIYPLLAWGMGVAYHAIKMLQTESPAHEKEFLQWRAQQKALETVNQTLLQSPAPANK